MSHKLELLTSNARPDWTSPLARPSAPLQPLRQSNVTTPSIVPRRRASSIELFKKRRGREEEYCRTIRVPWLRAAVLLPLKACRGRMCMPNAYAKGANDFRNHHPFHARAARLSSSDRPSPRPPPYVLPFFLASPFIIARRSTLRCILQLLPQPPPPAHLSRRCRPVPAP
jgi:hypothetical protein